MGDSKNKSKLVIGTLDKVDFPEFGLYEIPCKIDTGAQTSALHCHRVRLIEIEKEGKEIIAFELLDPSHEEYNGKEYRTTDFEERKVRSSSGHAEYRYVIRAKLLLFGETIETEFTLADRERMKYPILLGKSLLKGRFLVDVAKTNLSHKQKIKARKTSLEKN